MKLSIYMATRNGSTRNPPGAFAQLLERLRDLADELVVAVDYSSTDDTFEVAKTIHAKCLPFRARSDVGGNAQAELPALHPALDIRRCR